MLGRVGVGLGWGVRVDVNEEFKCLGRFTKKKSGGGVRRGSGGGSGWWGGQEGCQRNWRWGVMWGMGTKNRRYCTILRKLKKMCVCVGGGEGQYLNPKQFLFI